MKVMVSYSSYNNEYYLPPPTHIDQKFTLCVVTLTLNSRFPPFETIIRVFIFEIAGLGME